MNCTKRIAPEKFLCKYSLKTGCKCVGILMCLVSLASVLGFLCQMTYYKKCVGCPPTVLHDVYSFNINITLYYICIFFVNVWFIWGVKHEKRQVVLVWVVVTTVWWVQGSTLIFIHFLLNAIDIGWIISLCFAILGFLIFGYCILVGCGYWLEMKSNAETRGTTTETIPPIKK